MIDKLRQEIIQFLQGQDRGHLALNGLDGPWAAVVRFISAGLTLYLIEPTASDLVFFVENDPQLVLSIDQPEAVSGGGPWTSLQLFGTAWILAPHQLAQHAEAVQRAYELKSRQAPGVYVVIEIEPKRIYRITHHNGATQRDTFDLYVPLNRRNRA